MKTEREESSDGICRRKFLLNATVLGAGSVFSLPDICAAEQPPEITKIRLVRTPAICLAPMYVAEELLRLEGFTEVEYVEGDPNGTPALFEDRADVAASVPVEALAFLDAGKPLLLLAGIHGGALHDAERRLKQAKRDAKTAREQMKTLVARAKEMERRRATLETQLEKAKVEAESARQEAGCAASRAEEVAQAVDDADRAVQRAREALKDLSSRADGS
jgi:hypothetical protein